MKLDVNFSPLHNAANKMGAAKVDFELGEEQTELAPIDITLSDGIEVDLKDIDFDTGLASYQGRQVLLYIPDHGGRIEDALENGSKGNRFHVSDCEAIQKMKGKGRFNRYIVTNDLSEIFHVSGKDWQTKVVMEGKTDLKICKLCLKGLNYKDYNHASRWSIFNNFSIEEFFSTYSSFFKHMPKGSMGTIDKYSKDWSNISKKVRTENNYDCQQCGIHMLSHKDLLHVHHINGVKSDNSTKNLSVLCSDCHRKQPSHDHMFVKHEDTLLINKLRKQQNKLDPSSWDKVDKYADPALHGVIAFCKQYRLPAPELGVSITSGDGREVSKLDLAWPRKKVAIVIRISEAKFAREEGWNIWPVFETLEDFTKFAVKVR